MAKSIVANHDSLDNRIPIRIDPEFQALMRPLTDDERAELEAALLSAGRARDPLVVWQTEGEAVLLDGHNRLALCQTHNLPYTTTVAADVETRADARIWIIRNQRAKRNLTPQQHVHYGLLLKDELEAQARERQGHGQTAPGKSLPQSFAEASEDEPKETRETNAQIGKQAGKSREYVRKQEYIEAHAPAWLLALYLESDDPISNDAAYRVVQAYQEAHPEVKAFCDRVQMTDVSTIRLFTDGAKAGRDWWADIRDTGYLQLGDEDEAVRYDAGAKALEAAIDQKRLIHARLAAEAARAEREAEAAKLPVISGLHHGDCLSIIPTLPAESVRLLLTDPPYGMDFQSNRRVWTPQAPKITNDESPESAAVLLANMLRAAGPVLMPVCHLLVFVNWRNEPLFRNVIEKAGYKIAGSLVWVKENHSSGDLRGAFAPRHERIIHATRGAAIVSPRLDDVFMVSRSKETDHPTEKPVHLLKALIESTTVSGERVLDPFAGSGATLLAAQQAGRIGIGIELEDEWFAVCARRLGHAA